MPMRKQFKSSLPVIGAILAVSAILFALTFVFHFGQEASFGELTRDVTAIGRLPVYFGFLSQMGIFLWSASMAVCMLGVVILSKTSTSDRLKSFLLVSAILTLMISLDDVFRLHELVFPDAGIPQAFVLGSYATFTLIYLYRFSDLILETECILLAIALCFFGISVGLDVIEPEGFDKYLFEDGAKLIGQIGWFAYFFRVVEYEVATKFIDQAAALNDKCDDG